MYPSRCSLSFLSPVTLVAFRRFNYRPFCQPKIWTAWQSSRTDRSRWISRANPRRKFDETIVEVRFKAAQWEKEERECENKGEREPVTDRYEFSVREKNRWLYTECTRGATHANGYSGYVKRNYFGIEKCWQMSTERDPFSNLTFCWEFTYSRSARVRVFRWNTKWNQIFTRFSKLSAVRRSFAHVYSSLD